VSRYGAVKLLLVSLPVVLVVFDGGGEQSIAKSRFPYRSRSNMDFLSAQFVPNPDSPKSVVRVVFVQGRGGGRLPASMTVKAAPRFATILCLKDEKRLVYPLEARASGESGDSVPLVWQVGNSNSEFCRRHCGSGSRDKEGEIKWGFDC